MLNRVIASPAMEPGSHYRSAPRSPRRTVRDWLVQHPLTAVVLLTYALTWVVLVPIALESHGWLPFSIPPLAVLGAAWGPLLAAVAVVTAAGGRSALRAYFARLLIWRVQPSWYLLVLLGPAVYIVAGVAIARLTGLSDAPLPIAPYSPTQVAISFVATLLLAVAINTEEFAWRGVALRLMQQRHGALTASAILGLIHTVWHLPYFFTVGRPFYQAVGVPMFAAWTLALTILVTWVYNSTRGNLLLPVLFHAAQFAWQQLLSPADPVPFFISVGVLWVLVAGVVAVYGPRTLASGRGSSAATWTGATA
jgi:membrane protease YdiL (CAAX protease family)